MSFKFVKQRSCIDKTLTHPDNSNTNFKEQHTLSIQISLDGFSFCILNRARNKFVALEAYSFSAISNYPRLCEALNTLLTQIQWLNTDFSSVNAIFCGEKTTLIPLPLFEESEAGLYLKFNYKPEPGEHVCFDKLVNLQACNVYAIPLCIKEFIQSKFNNCTISHHASSLIESLLIRHKNQDLYNRIFVNVRNAAFDIILIEGAKLIFYNAFPYKSKEDFVYFLMYTLEQLKLNPENIDMVLMGETDKSSALFEISYKYIRSVYFLERNDFFDYSHVFDEIQPHQFYNLLNINMCEL